MVVLVTLDSPRIMLVLDHMFMLFEFAMSVFPPQDGGGSSSSTQLQDDAAAAAAAAAAESRRLDTPGKSAGPNTSSSPASASGGAEEADGGATGASGGGDGGGLIYKVDILHPEIILLADPKNRSSEALVMSINQIVIAQEGMFCATMDEICVLLCT
ncbi:hypothetical protein EV177_010915, partial [Coemansia sp. RSA 1804]